MSYLVLARKYRPQTFEDLTGQEQVRQTLTKALETGRVAHAYLFTGPRGVGKTTAARLLAMALACQSSGPKPCGVCPNCLEIQNGECVDLMEVDGASNRGINEIRGLRDTVKYLPAKNPYKVYIIDEVHALTNDAFNALLKTLEEPPDHVIFIFATTEAHKVPATILSRCQRYDFKRIRTEDITNRLIKVAEIENIPAEPAALTIIARQAEGGLRDALGMMDQVIASAGEITVAAVDLALGLINQNIISQTAKAAFRGDTGLALDLMEKAYNLGSDFRELAIRVLEYVRGLTLFKANPKAADFLDLTENEIADYQALAKEMSLALIHRHFEAWLRFQGELSRHPQPRWLMEAHLIKLCQTAPLADLAALTARLTTLLESSPDLLKKNIELLMAARVAQPPKQVTPTAVKPLTPAPSEAPPEASPEAPKEVPKEAPLETPPEPEFNPRPLENREPKPSVATDEPDLAPNLAPNLAPDEPDLAPDEPAPAPENSGSFPPIAKIEPNWEPAKIPPKNLERDELDETEDDDLESSRPTLPTLRPRLNEKELAEHFNKIQAQPAFVAFKEAIGGSLLKIDQRAKPLSPMLIPEAAEEQEEDELDESQAKDAPAEEAPE